MLCILRSSLVAAALLGFCAAANAQEAGVAVTGQGFCITRSEMRCEEVALPGSSVPIERLPKATDGTRVIYFYSDQRAAPKSLVVHVLEAEDMDAGAKIKMTKPLEAQASQLSAPLQAIAKKLAHGGAVQLTPFQTEASGAKPARLFSSIAVDGPGTYSGQVVDIDGNLIAGSERASFTVTRGPAGKAPRAPGSGLGSYDADG